jgi:uncharacterized protein (TIGR03437 family)
MSAWLLVLSPGLWGQSTGVLTRVSTTAREAAFLVDGQVFTGAATFTWPAGSKHQLSVAAWQYGSSLKTRYVFERWATSAGQLPSPSNYVTITADPGVTWFNADLTTEYAISLVFFQCVTPPCASPGTIWVDQVGYRQDADVWGQAGTSVLLSATPNDGYVFAGWAQGPAASLYSLTLNAPVTLYPTFAPARAVQLLTSPDGLQLLADRAPVTSPTTLEWGTNTSHSLGAVSPQFDLQGRLWVFRSWSDGGAQNHTYTVPPGAAATSVTAEFVRAVATLIETGPPGLSITVDGTAAAAPRNLFWGPGETHTISAPAKQYDAAGNPWVFRSWSNGAGNPQQIQTTGAQADSGIRLTATYDPLSRIRMESVPSGLSVEVDGSSCHTPCEIERPVGTLIRVTAPALVQLGDGARLEFVSWNGGDTSTFTAPAGLLKIRAQYRTAYRLALTTEPAGAGGWRVSAVPNDGWPDGFYAAGAQLIVGVEAAEGMKFREWGQDLSGSANPTPLTMDGPHAVTAYFDKLPEKPPPPRILNAAGPTTVDAVAPSSIASVFGTDLAETTAQATTDPLPQALGGVTLRCDGRLAPLLYVSPEQINFQVPGDLADGQYKLEVIRQNAAKLEIEFSVARNAPGLFAAAHLDGTPVTSESPARPGEQVILYGTGLGPFLPRPPDGFRVPAAPPYALADPIEVTVQGRAVPADSSGALSGSVGVASVQIRLPDELDAGIPVEVTVRAGQAVSNALPIPVKY